MTFRLPRAAGVLRPFAVAAALAAAFGASAQLRVANWNVTNYSSGRVVEFQTAIYGEFQGRQMAPDILVGQEFLSAAAVVNFRNLLNTAPGSPGDWASAPYLDGPDSDSAFFYRTSRVRYLRTTTVATGGNAPNQPRNTYRYDVQPIGYDAAGATLAIYATHMKAGSTSTDVARRLVEAQRIRDDAQALPAGWHFVLSGDINMQSSSQSAYVELVGSQLDNAGRLFDPISTPGSWENNGAFRFVHTQEPGTQMDSRHDQILLSAGLVDGQGFDYLGTFGRAYSTSTWNDPFHSYRAWGNDGQSFDQPIRTALNTMVGPTIAQALIGSTAGNGHLPVFLDLRVPPVAGLSTARLDFGLVMGGQVAELPVDVENLGDTERWGFGGVADLRFTLRPTPGLIVPTATQLDPPGGAFARVPVRLDTAKAGRIETRLYLDTNDPARPVLAVDVTGTVVGVTDGAPQRRPGSMRRR